MAETLEDRGQDMEQEPPDELDSIEGHEPLTVAMGVVLPSKGDLTIRQLDERRPEARSSN